MIHENDLPPLPGIVSGSLWHHRTEQLERTFEHRLDLWLVDVDDLPDHGPIASFRAADHLGDADATLRENVEACLRAHGHDETTGRIVMLASARVAGYVFDPLTVFWCFSPTGELRCVVAEVHNTYGERAAYLLELDDAGRAEADKTFYVSPFFPVDGGYRMRFDLRPDRVGVDIDLHRHGQADPVFRASFEGRPRPATTAHVLRTAVARPLMPQRVSALIRWHGVGLFLRRLPLVTRPVREHDATVDGPMRPPWDEIDEAPRPLAVAGRALLARRAVQYASRIAGVSVAVCSPADLAETLHRADSHRVTGAPGARAQKPLGVLVTPAALRRLARHPKIGLADGYVAGDWAPDPNTDLGDLLTAYAAHFTDLLPSWLWKLRRVSDEALPSATRNDRRGSRSNISAHYDLSNDLFELFLDPTMTYSAALFDEVEQGRSSDGTDDPDALERAQERKLDGVLDLAGVSHGSRVLEIGTGWGSLALRAAARGARVTTVTLSVEQAAEAERRAVDAGVDDLVDVRIEDYRDVEGTYDAVVSIEMIEAVGEEYWPTYLQTLENRLVPGGRAVVQAITMSHERLLATHQSHGWIQEYIFPGGLIPSVHALANAAAAHTGLTVDSARRFGGDYARTLRLWRRRFLDHESAVRELDFSERFVRLWELYLAYCEAGFASGYLDVEHLVFTAPQHAASACIPDERVRS